MTSRRPKGIARFWSCLSIDEEVSAMLSLEKSDARFYSKDVVDMKLTDFGFIAKLDAERGQAE
jgi:hypothetical protein